ncbi:MAG: Neelaredoxin [Syntrophorhabdus sp.]|nr:Neelaredoxin [Syntrophorhabdus sp.]
MRGKMVSFSGDVGSISKLGPLFQIEEGRRERHIPVIDCPDTVAAGRPFVINVTIGREVDHPNTTDHHIKWVQVFFRPENDKFSYEIAHCDFAAHGDCAAGIGKGPVVTDHRVSVVVSVNGRGRIYALSLCSIHGLWENGKDLQVR